MEKDYFRDRPNMCRERDSLKIGQEAFICLKAMQPIAKDMDDLTRITITSHLTSQKYHPRGCKLQGTAYQRDLEGNILYNNGFEITNVVGRCTYPMTDKNEILTQSGPKKLMVKDGKLTAETPQKDTFNLAVSFGKGNAFVDCIINPYKIETIKNLEKSLNGFDFQSVLFNGEYVFLKKTDGGKIAIKPFSFELSGKKVDELSFLSNIEIPSKDGLVLKADSWYGVISNSNILYPD